MRVRLFVYPLILIILGFLIFHSVLLKGFILDDKSQILQNTAVHSITSIPTFFLKSLHYNSVTDQEGFTYRPITYTSYAFFYALGQGGPFMFHLFLLLLYIANSILVFFVFSRFTKPSIAFLLSLLFLIHPANQEIAAYIADIQDVLYFFFGVSAILVITSKIADTKQLFLSSLLLLLACISKETGVLFIFAASVYLFLTKSPQLRRYMITYGVLLFGYFLVRFYAGQTAFLTITIPSHSTIQDLSLHSHILLIPKILAYYITAIIMPLPALPTEYLTTADPLTSILSFLFICLVYSGMVFVGKIIKRRNKKAFTLYIFFFSFFLVSSLFHSQIIPLDVLVSKRWLYVQLFTFLAMICIVLDVYFVKIKKYKLLFLLFFTAYAGILLTETFIAMTFY